MEIEFERYNRHCIPKKEILGSSIDDKFEKILKKYQNSIDGQSANRAFEMFSEQTREEFQELCNYVEGLKLSAKFPERGTTSEPEIVTIDFIRSFLSQPSIDERELDVEDGLSHGRR